MESIFIKLLNMGLAAGWLALAVMLLRLLLQWAPRALIVVFWACVGVRLICPFSFKSVCSLLPSAETVPADILYTDTPRLHSGIPAVNAAIDPLLSESLSPQAGASVNPMQIIVLIAAAVWLLGVTAMLLYTVSSYLRIRRRVREAVPYAEGIWACDRIDTPFILGLLRPRIYLPSDIAAQDAVYVIAHERAHLQRRDHWWKPLGFLLLTVYCFTLSCGSPTACFAGTSSAPAMSGCSVRWERKAKSRIPPP